MIKMAAKEKVLGLLLISVVVALCVELPSGYCWVYLPNPITDHTTGVTIPAGNYTSLERINGQWYINGQAYPPISSNDKSSASPTLQGPTATPMVSASPSSTRSPFPSNSRSSASGPPTLSGGSGNLAVYLIIAVAFVLLLSGAALIVKKKQGQVWKT